MPAWRTCRAVRTARLCALAFLHDFGKANHRFQRGDGAM
ncbi:HD domain-containing protein [Xanthobacter variabilis]